MSGIGINKLSKDQVSEIVKNNTSLNPYFVEEVTENKRGSQSIEAGSYQYIEP